MERLLCMHSFLPWRFALNKLCAGRFAAHTEMLHEVAAAALAENVGVVCWRANGNRFGCNPITVAEIVRNCLQLSFAQPDVVVEYNIVRWFRLAHGQ